MLISIVVPVYREEKNIPEFLSRIVTILEKVTSEFEIIFSMDPLPDRPEEVILEHRSRDQRIKLLKFSRRFGQPVGTLAGLQYAGARPSSWWTSDGGHLVGGGIIFGAVYADFFKIRSQLGWTPRKPLRETIESTLNYYCGFIWHYV